MMESSKFLVVGLVLVICAFIFQLIGLASPYWITYEALTYVKVNIGLWKFCAESTKPISVVECWDTTETVKEAWFNAVRAMSVLGLIALLISAVMTILKLFAMKEKKIPKFVAIGTAFGGAVFILIAIAVFAAKMNEDNAANIAFDYHFAFAFCILAMLSTIAAGCLMLVDAVKVK